MPQGAQHPAPDRAWRRSRRSLWATRLNELAPEPGGLNTRADELGLYRGKLLLGAVGALPLAVQLVAQALHRALERPERDTPRLGHFGIGPSARNVARG